MSIISYAIKYDIFIVLNIINIDVDNTCWCGKYDSYELSPTEELTFPAWELDTSSLEVLAGVAWDV